MAEASSSGEESSELEEHEASLSLSGPVSPITTATPHNKTKKLRYFTDYGYLQRLPEHQRRRIQEEIEKGYKPGEMAMNTLVDIPSSLSL